MSNIRQNTARESNELRTLTDPGEVFKNPAQLTFIRQLVDILSIALGNMVRRDQASPQLILSAPNGTAFSVTVANDGTLSTRQIDRNNRAG